MTEKAPEATFSSHIFANPASEQEGAYQYSEILMRRKCSPSPAPQEEAPERSQAPFFPTYRRGHYPQPPSILPLKSPRPFPKSPGGQVETLFEATGEMGGASKTALEGDAGNIQPQGLA